ASAAPPAEAGPLGLGGATPTLTLAQSFTVTQPPDAVWRMLTDVGAVVPCIPGASITGMAGDRIAGRMTVKLGPVTAAFDGDARVTRDEAARRGTIAGTGRDRLTRSRVDAEATYTVVAAAEGTRVDILVRALLSGPFAQMGRSGLVEDLAGRLTRMFAGNLARLMAQDPASRAAPPPAGEALSAGALLRAVLRARLVSMLDRVRGALRR
ncbi:SRPBCC family protein, partial [Rhodoplanes roseus]